MKISGWETKAVRKGSTIKRRWKHRTLGKSNVIIDQLHPNFDYITSVRQLSKQERFAAFKTIPKGTVEHFQIGRFKTLEDAEKKAINWMEKHPEG